MKNENQYAAEGGPAFPHAGTGGYAGQTLRDYFAGQVLMGRMASVLTLPTTTEEIDAITQWSYTVADSMLSARDA